MTKWLRCLRSVLIFAWLCAVQACDNSSELAAGVATGGFSGQSGAGGASAPDAGASVAPAQPDSGLPARAGVGGAIAGTGEARSAGAGGTPAAVGGRGAAGVAGVRAAVGGAGSLAAAGSSGTGAAGGGAGRGAAGSTAPLANTTIYIAGDSTVMTYTSGDLEGWGQELGPFFDSRVSIVNKAIGGRSVAYFMYTVEMDASGNYVCSDNQGTPKFRLDASGKRVDTSQWSQIKSGMKSGDFLMIQFGHNDETHDCPRYVSTADYETELGNMADIARAKGATPIFVTPMGHRSFSGAMVRNTLLPYANAMKDEASQKMVEVADLNLRSMEYYMMVGDAYLASNIFDGGTTHFHKAGAIKMAELIVGELKKNNGPLAAYLKQ